MEETDVYVQIYSFLVVCYDEKPDKNLQRGNISDVVRSRKVPCLTVRLNQPASGTKAFRIHVPEMYQTFSLESQYSGYSKTLKHICEATCK